jgi:hypothetical protein
MDDHEKLERARQQVEAMTGFYVHLAVYAVVMAGLLVVNLAASDVWWVQWPLLGWGIGIVAHAVAVFGQQAQLVTSWQMRKIREIRDRM